MHFAALFSMILCGKPDLFGGIWVLGEHYMWSPCCVGQSESSFWWFFVVIDWIALLRIASLLLFFHRPDTGLLTKPLLGTMIFQMWNSLFHDLGKLFGLLCFPRKGKHCPVADSWGKSSGLLVGRVYHTLSRLVLEAMEDWGIRLDFLISRFIVNIILRLLWITSCW